MSDDAELLRQLRPDGAADDVGAGGYQPRPGKVSLTQRVAVQRRAAAAPASAVPGLAFLAQPPERAPLEAHDDPFALHVDAVHGAAARGLEAPATTLPHLETIQAAFGHHDVSHVQAHVGGAAADASAAMGAQAYATGDHVAFAAAPDLHTAAHEAAHTVQQRGGIQLAGGVGAEHDVHERHADAVADRVVAGHSAQDLLDQVAPRTIGAPSGVDAEPRAPSAAGASSRFAGAPPTAAGVQMRLSPHMAEIRTRLTVNGAHPAIVESEITQVLVWLRELNETDLADTVVQLDAESLVNTLLDHVERAERTGRFAGLLGRLQRARTRADHLARAATLATRGGNIDADEAQEILLTLVAVTGDRRRMLVQDLQRAGRLAPFLAALNAADRAAHAAVVADVERIRTQFDDPMADTHVATAAEATAVDRILTPGVARGVGGARAPFRDTVNGKTYRQDIEEELERLRVRFVAAGNALLARPMLPGGLAALHPMADEAKTHTDALFGHLRAGPPLRSTGPNPTLRDQSAIAGDAEDMVTYLIHNQAEILPIHRRHDAIPTDATEAGIITGIINDWIDPVANPARVADLRLIDRTWPGTSNAGVVRMHPREEATPAATRRMRWDSFQTFIHEYLHNITHPNYDRVANAIGGLQKSILIEGVTSLMTDKVWQAIFPAEIRANEALRASVEGSAMPFDPAAIPPITHYDQIADARRLEAAVGVEELKAAYFMGHTEMIGVGPGAAAARAHGTQYTVPPAGVTTVADVATATGVPAATIAAANGIAPGDPVTAGQRLTVAGIRLHHVVSGEDRARIADINGISVADLLRANPHLGPAGALAAGTVLTIPVH